MTETALGFAQHDHGACVQNALARADAICAGQGLQFTQVRRRTLEILLESHAALGAYDVLSRLDADGFGGKPPVAYRALTFLTENGFAHRIERLNAFVACSHLGAVHRPSFMICRTCRAVAEVPKEGDSPFTRLARDTGFQIEEVVIEAIGLCPSCQEVAA